MESTIYEQAEWYEYPASSWIVTVLISVGDSGIFDPINLTIRVCSYPANRVTLNFEVLTYLAKTKATLA